MPTKMSCSDGRAISKCRTGIRATIAASSAWGSPVNFSSCSAPRADTGGGGTTVSVEGRPQDALGQRVCLVRATPEFFSTMRIPLRAGRVLNESDTQREPFAAVINETAARRYWKGTNPIGSRFTYGTAAPDSTWRTVVGVVADTRRAGAEREPPLQPPDDGRDRAPPQLSEPVMSRAPRRKLT